MIYRLLLLTVGLFLGCESGREPDRLSNDQPSSLQTLRYRFVARGSGLAEPSRTMEFQSQARGKLELVSLDDPPLVVGSINIEHMQLRSSGQGLAKLDPGEWQFMARRTTTGSFDAVWLADEMPPEVKGLVRFVLGELHTHSTNVVAVQEEIPLGLVEARYTGVRSSLATALVRIRRAPNGARNLVGGATMFFIDEVAPVIVISSLSTRTALLGKDSLSSQNILLVARESKSPLADSEAMELRRKIDALSATPPLSLVEQPRSKQETDALRREAEPWDAVLARLRAPGDIVDPALIHRAAAHLSVDEALAATLEPILCDPSTTRAAVGAVGAALGDCGTSQCQATLVGQLRPGHQSSPEILAALARVREPTATTVDLLIEISRAGDDAIRSLTGVVVSRFAETDPQAATASVEQLIAGITGCPVELEAWFGLLGNAGLVGTKSLLLRCLEADIDAGRRASAARAMRRIPGAEVSETLVGLAAHDLSERVQLASLAALASRELGDAELAPLVIVDKAEWGVPRLTSLLDVLERVHPPAHNVGSLVQELMRSDHQEVAQRARQTAVSLGQWSDQ